MSDKPVCDRCESEDLVLGKLSGHSALGFRPFDAPALSTTSAWSEVRGFLCMACGHLRLVGDRRSVGKALGRFMPEGR